MAKITSEGVFQRIKQLSQRTADSSNRVLVSDIAVGMYVSQDSLLLVLNELENSGLIRYLKH